MSSVLDAGIPSAVALRMDAIAGDLTVDLQRAFSLPLGTRLEWRPEAAGRGHRCCGSVGECCCDLDCDCRCRGCDCTTAA